MNENTPNSGTRPGNGAETDALALLIRAAGHREAPPDEAYQQVLAATRGTWQRKVRRRTYWRVANAIAASVAVAAVVVGVSTFRPSERTSPVRVAMTDVIVGVVSVRQDEQAEWRDVDGGGTPVMSGSRLRTDRGSGAGLLLRDDISLRLDAATEIAFEAADRIQLLAGAVYVDTGADAHTESAIEIVTDAGVFSDVGTQFEVRRLGAVHRLRVREGLVRLQRPTDEIETVAESEIMLQSDGSFRRAHISAQDDDWHWVHAVGPAPYVEDQSLADLLEWVSRETGRAIRFADPKLAVSATQTRLHGSRQRLLPMDALAVMLATTDFRYSVTPAGDILMDAER